MLALLLPSFAPGLETVLEQNSALVFPARLEKWFGDVLAVALAPMFASEKLTKQELAYARGFVAAA